jgi:hypothetical protein
MAGPSEPAAYEWRSDTTPPPDRQAEPVAGRRVRQRAILGGGIGLLIGLVIKDSVTGGGDGGPILLLGLIPALALVGLSILFKAVVGGRRDLFVGLLAALVGVVAGAVFGPESANAAHRATGTATITTAPGNFSWSGGVTCTWKGGQVSSVEATPMDEGHAYVVYLALTRYGRGEPIDGGIGAGTSVSTIEARLTDVTASDDLASGTAKSEAFPAVRPGGVPGGFPGSVIAFEWSCGRP